PARAGAADLGGAVVPLGAAPLGHAGHGEVPGEEAGVHVDRGDPAGGPEPDQRPVVAWFPPAPGLPAVHDLTAVPVPARLEGRGGRRQQVLLLAEGLVAGGDDAAAQPARGEIGLRPHLAAPPGGPSPARPAPAGPSPAAAGRRPSAVDSGHAVIFFASGGA